MEWWIRLEAVDVRRVPEAVEGICYVPETVEVVVCVLEVPEAMPCVLLAGSRGRCALYARGRGGRTLCAGAAEYGCAVCYSICWKLWKMCTVY